MKLKKYFMPLGLSVVSLVPFGVISCSQDNTSNESNSKKITTWAKAEEIAKSKLNKESLTEIINEKIDAQANQAQKLAQLTEQGNTFKILKKEVMADYKNNAISFDYTLEYKKEKITYYYQAKASSQAIKQKNNISGLEIDIKQYSSRNQNSAKATTFKKEFVSIEDFFAKFFKGYSFAINNYNPDVIKDISLYNTNDLHGNAWEEIRHDKNDKTKIDYRKSRVGLEKTLGYVESNPADIFLDGGDFFAGSSITNFDKGKTLVEAANMMGYDGMAIGNHEFDFGSELMSQNSQLAPFYSANIVNASTKKTIYPTNFIKTIKGGEVSVGLFSLMNLGFDDLVAAGNRKNISVSSLIEVSKKQVQAFKKAGVDLIVAFGHVGNGDGYLETSKQIMQAVPEIDIFVDGHTHREEFYQIDHENFDPSYIVQAYCFGRMLGTHSFDVNTKTDSIVLSSFKTENLNYKSLVSAKPNQALSTKLHNLQTKFNQKYAELSFKKGANTKFSLKEKYKTETSMGNFFSDSQEWWASKILKENPELVALNLSEKVVSLQNAGGIRVALDKPTLEVTKKDLLDVSPFGNKPYILKVSGKQLKDILNDGAKRFEHSSYPALSQNIQLDFYVDSASLNKDSKGYANNIKVNGKEVVDTEFYALTISDYVYNGGDGYSIFKDLNLKPIYESPLIEQWQVLEMYGKFLADPNNSTNSKYKWDLYNKDYIKPLEATRIKLHGLDNGAIQKINELNNPLAYFLVIKNEEYEDLFCSHQHGYHNHHQH